MRRYLATAVIHFIIVPLAVCCAVEDALGQDQWTTVAEKSDYRTTATYDEAIEYCRRLDDASDWVQMTSFGVTPQGRDMKLLVVSQEGAFTPEAARRTGKTILMIQNGIHSGEIDGKDATLALLRDIVITKERASLLDSVIIVIIPILNIDGHENRVRYTRPNQDGPDNAGFRATSQRLNLNRDYLKADSPEMKYWVLLWRQWMPHFFIDDHVTDGHDWQYVVTYSAPWQPNSDTAVRTWVKHFFDSSFTRAVRGAGYPVFPYASYVDERQIEKGVNIWVDSPRFSTGYVALWNRPGLLVEMHSLKDYKTRVLANYTALVAVLDILNARGRALQQATALADRKTAGGEIGPYPLTFERTGDSMMVEIATYESRWDSSAITGGWYPGWDHNRPITVRMPYFNVHKPRVTVVPPRAYFIPREWTEQIDLLRLHGVEFDTLVRELTAPVERYYLDSAQWETAPFESHLRVKYKTIRVDTTMSFPVGTAVVDMLQPAAKVIMQALEPQAVDCLVSWGMWNAIFERKEYIDDYMVEPLADSLLEHDAALRAEYEARLASDTAFAGSVTRKREFFYKNSSYYEHDHNWYPVTRFHARINFIPPWRDWN